MNRKRLAVLLFALAALLPCGALEKLEIYLDGSDTLVFQTSDPNDMAAILKTVKVDYEQWNIDCVLPRDADGDFILAAYQCQIDKLKSEKGYQSVDVVRMTPDHPDKKVLREKFLKEHIHTEDEVRFFVEGSGLFYIHQGGCVFVVLCESGDLISIPANYPHWFDMGEEPFFTAIRFFTNNEGWIAHFTGSDISDRFIE